MIKIAIASGKGGTGKTFLSTNLFAVMQEAGLRVGVVDCDAEVPNSSLFLKGKKEGEWPVDVFCPSIDKDKCTFCGQCAEVCHFHAITCIPAAKYVKVMTDLCHACTACVHFCPNGAIISGRKEVGRVTAYGDDSGLHLIEARIKEGEHSPVPIIEEAIRRAEAVGWEYLLLDAPPGCACPFVSTVKDADIVLLVTEPTPFGLSDLRHTVKVLRRLGKPFFVVVNRADMGNRSMRDYLCEEHIEVLAEIPYSQHIAALYSKGKLAVGNEPEVSELFARLMHKILQYESSCH